MWLLLCVLNDKTSFQPVFSRLFRLIVCNVAVILIWPWEEVSVPSTYSVTILDPCFQFFWDRLGVEFLGHVRILHLVIRGGISC